MIYPTWLAGGAGRYPCWVAVIGEADGILFMCIAITGIQPKIVCEAL